MATTAQIDAAANTPKKPVIGGSAVEGHHILAGVSIRPEDQPKVDRINTRAARHAVRRGRAETDPNADLVLDILGLAHHDAAPDPAPAPAQMVT